MYQNVGSLSDLLTTAKNSIVAAINEIVGKLGIDWIVEEGTSGIWTYRKWNSGIAECWGVQSNSGTFSAWGSVYAHDIPQVAFPVGLFVSLDFDTVSVKCTSGNTVASVNADGGTINNASSATCIRGTNLTGTLNFYARRYAIGRWK